MLQCRRAIGQTSRLHAERHTGNRAGVVELALPLSIDPTLTQVTWM